MGRGKITKSQEEYLATLPDSHKNAYRRALAGSLAFAIKAKCRECCGYENASRRVRECEITTCPLYNVRR